MAKKLFKGKRREEMLKPGPEFALVRGLDAEGKLMEENFACLPEMPAWAITRLGSVELGNVSRLQSFILACVEEKDETRLQECISNKAFIYSVQDLSDVVDFLIEEYTGRPPVRSTESSDGPNGITTGSKGNSSSPELITKS